MHSNILVLAMSLPLLSQIYLALRKFFFYITQMYSLRRTRGSKNVQEYIESV